MAEVVRVLNRKFKGKYYIVQRDETERKYPDDKYLHPDLIWRSTTLNGNELTGYYDTEEHANKTLEQLELNTAKKEEV